MNKSKNIKKQNNKKSTKDRTKSSAKAKGKKLSRENAKSTKKAKGKSATRIKDKSIRKVKAISKTKIRMKGRTVDSKTITFEIDGINCSGKAGQSIVEAAKDNGIYIPVLCYYEGMKPAGICRMCTVKVGGRNMAACTTPIAEGMIIENNIPELENMRKAIVEMLFVEGNHMCPTCEKSGNCELQALGYRYKILVPRFPYQFPVRGVDATYTKIIIDNNRCVQCRRCIRDITSKDGKHIFALTKRSGKSTIIADRVLEAKINDALAKKAMDQCPVGAILKKEVGFIVPIGKRKYDHLPIGSDVHK